MKKIIYLLISLLMLTITSVHAEDIKIVVNGKEIVSDVAPIIENSRTLVPVRTISEALMCDVAWDNENKAVSVFDGAYMYFLWIDKDAAFKIDGSAICGSYLMDVSPKILNDRTLVPIRCISELFGADVNWDDKTRTVNIDYTPLFNEAPEEGSCEQYSAYTLSMSEMYDTYRDYCFSQKRITKAEIELENGGIIKLDLYKDIAPISVNNFIHLAVSGAFEGKIFHRVINDFVIQGGAFDVDGNQSEANPIMGEFIMNGSFNLIPHKRGAISMARTNEPNSASNQFFIVHKDADNLNGAYAAFGVVSEGMEYVDEIAISETDENDKPIQNHVIKSVKITQY